ncbi:hypothetical protein ACT4S5_13305 [Kocuria oceani]|uniref:hypothetical protein n=1 Tax=Kocuria oceani TaxID=988827 RepID=UPI00403588CA
MAFRPRRYDRPSHLSVVRDPGHSPVVHTVVDSMLEQLPSLDHPMVDRVAEGIGPAGSDGSEAMDALIRTVAGAGRMHEWDEIYREVCDELERTGQQRTYAISPAFLAAAFRELVGTDGFTALHYDTMTASWRTHVGRIHPEDESLKDGEPPVFGCGPRELPEDWPSSWQDFWPHR